MKSLKQSLAVISIVSLCMSAQAQTEGVSIKSSVSPPHPSAMLDVDNSSKGVLVPRVALVATNNATSPILSPATSLLVYNTATAGTTPYNVTPGYYFYDGTVWQRLINGTGGTAGYWSAGVGNDIYRGTVATAVTDGATLVGTDVLPSGSKSELFVHGPSTFYSGGLPLGTPDPPLSTSGIHLGEPIDALGGHWNEINVPDYYMDLQFNTGQDVHMGNIKGSDLYVHNGTSKAGDIHADGTIYANGGTYSLSDSTAKKNIVAFSDVLPKVSKCNTYKYNYKQESNDTKKHMGVLAQEIEAQFPELVTDVKTTVQVAGTKFSDKQNAITKVNKAVDYAGLTAVLLQALKEQQAQIETLKAKVAALENR